MAKFVYRLQNILNLKLKLEDQAKNEYAIIKKMYDDTLELKTLEEEKLHLEEAHLKMLMSKRLDFSQIRISRNGIERLKENVEKINRQLEEIRKRLNYASKKMSEAMIERKTHEKLKENAFGIFIKDTLSAENKETDELVSFKYNNSSEDV